MMESTWPRFIIAVYVCTIYLLAMFIALDGVPDGGPDAVVWSEFFNIPGIAEPESFRPLIGAILTFLFAGLMGGLLVFWVKREGRYVVLIFGFIIVLTSVGHPLVNDLSNGVSEVEALARVILRASSLIGAIAVFYVIAFKRVEAEAA